MSFHNSMQLDIYQEYEAQLNWKEEIDSKIEKGLIDKDLKPLKCECGCTEFVDKNESYINMGVVEHDRHCKGCDALVGSWSHGSWQL